MELMRVKFLLLSILVLHLVSCQKKTLVHEYKHVNADGWRRSDTIAFQIPLVEESGIYEVSVGLRLRDKFSNEEVYVTTELHLDEPTVNMKNTTCITATDQDGELLGYGITYHQYEQPCMKIRLQKGQHGKIMVYHNTNKEVLSHLTDIGVCIDR